MTEPRYAVRFTRSVVRDLPRLDKRLSGVCEAAAARPLWSYRVGDCRVIQAFNDVELWILVVG